MIPKKLVQQVLDRDDELCVLAGPNCLSRATVADHRANRGQDGSKILDCPENLVAACGICNGDKEDRAEWRTELVRRGVRVPKAASNVATRYRCAVTAVTYPDGSVWFLLPSGKRQRVDDPEF